MITNKTLELENGTATAFDIQAIQANFKGGSGWIEIPAYADETKTSPLQILSVQFNLDENDAVTQAVRAFGEQIISTCIDKLNTPPSVEPVPVVEPSIDATTSVPTDAPVDAGTTL